MCQRAVNLHLSETCNNSLMGRSDGASVWMCRHALAGAEVDTLRRAFAVAAVYDNRKRPAVDATLSQTKL